MCSALDETNGRYYLPDLPVSNSSAVASIGDEVNGFPQRESFLYPVSSEELGCQGMVSAVRFCYGDLSATINLGTRRRIFTLLILEEMDGSQFRVTETVDVHSTPTNQICTQERYLIINAHYCCDTFPLDHPTANFAFSITNEHRLLQFDDDQIDQRIQVDHYKISMPALQLPSQGTFTPSENDRRFSQQLKIFQFFISKLKLALA